MENPDISVVIVSYKVWGYLLPCVKLLFAQQGINIEIIVVDNNSSDGTVVGLRNQFPSVMVVENKENKGFSAANNQGIKMATGNYILLLNPDTEIKEKDALLKLKKSIENENPDGILAPCLLNEDGSFQQSFWNIPGITKLFLELFYLHRKRNSTKPFMPVFVEGVSGAAMFFKKKLVDEIGLLDEKMFWMEDMDFCYRAAKAGKKVLYDPTISIIHYGGKSSSNYSVVIPNQVISKIKFYKKHGSWLSFIIMDKLSFLFIVSRWCVFALLSISGNDIQVKKRKAYAIAFNKFFRYNFRHDDSIISA